MQSHIECEVNIDSLGRVTYEKNPNYYIEITFSNTDEESYYTVRVKILKPFGSLVPDEKSFKFPFSESGRSDATRKYLEERSIIDNELYRT